MTKHKQMIFTQFILTRHAYDDPRGDFIRDARKMIERGQLVPDPTTWVDLNVLISRAKLALGASEWGRVLWNQFAGTKGDCSFAEDIEYLYRLGIDI